MLNPLTSEVYTHLLKDALTFKLSILVADIRVGGNYVF